MRASRKPAATEAGILKAHLALARDVGHKGMSIVPLSSQGNEQVAALNLA